MAETGFRFFLEALQAQNDRVERKRCRGCKVPRLVDPTRFTQTKLGAATDRPSLTPAHENPAPTPLPMLEDYTGAVCLLHKLTATYPTYLEVLIDLDDFEHLTKSQWTLVAVGWPRAARVVRSGKGEYLHRVIMSAPADLFVDHVYHNPLDNRKKRLRLCTHRQNVRNNRPKRTAVSKYKGVSWDRKRRRWVVSCGRSIGKRFYAVFDCEKEAARAYNDFAAANYGEFAYLNRV